jgi:hypothetical protein
MRHDKSQSQQSRVAINRVLGLLSGFTSISIGEARLTAMLSLGSIGDLLA